MHVSCEYQHYKTENVNGQVAYFMTESIFRAETRHPDRFYNICVKGNMPVEVDHWEIDEWVMTLIKVIFEKMEDITNFLLYSVANGPIGFKKRAHLFQPLLAAIPKNKPRIICYRNLRYESPLKTLIHHWHFYKQLLEGV